MKRLSRLTSFLVLVLALVSTGCGYIKHRMLDMSDVIDIKYGYGLGLGVKVEATLWVGAGVGYGYMTKTREWYGRRSLVAYNQEFLHFIIAGRDGTAREWGEPPQDGTDHYNIVLPINLSAVDMRGWPFRPSLLQCFRTGFEVIVPAFNVGLYLNEGELLDFILGLVTVDIADDDGIPKSGRYEDNFREYVAQPNGGPAPES